MANLRLLVAVVSLCLCQLGDAAYRPTTLATGGNWPWVDLWSELLYIQQQQSQLSTQHWPLPDTARSHGALWRQELEPEENFAESEEDHARGTNHNRGRDEAVARAIGPFITPIANDEASRECLISSWTYLTSIFKERWALKMFDATGKLPNGILQGNINPFGNWDECLNTTGYFAMNGSSGALENDFTFTGKHCIAFISRADGDSEQRWLRDASRGPIGLAPILPTLASSAAATVGVCIPSTCTGAELAMGLNLALKNVTVDVQEYMCHSRDDRTEFSSGDIAMIVLCSLVGCLMLVGTMIDIVAVRAAESGDSWWARANSSHILPGTLREVLLAFSVYTNGRKLLDTSTTKDTLGCLHGIRFISNTWVIFGHTYFFLNRFKHRNPHRILTFYSSVAFSVVTNGTISVDTFFLLSGLLVGYATMRAMQRTNGSLNIVMFYVHRYIRLTPVMMMVIAFMATLYRHLGSGPWWWAATLGNPSRCQDVWWKNMLYINNADDLSEQCLGQSWYLANDMQMFLFSPLILVPLYRWPVLGQLWLIFLFCLFAGINAMITAVNNIGPNSAIKGGGNFDLRYEKPWARAGPYLIGLYIGWLMYKLRGRRIKLPAPVVAIGWLASSLTACLVIYGLYDNVRLDDGHVDPSRTTSIVYGMLGRSAWALSVSWVVFACVTGHGGPVDTLLSWKALIPLSRLTYVSYLISVDTQLYYYYTNKSPFYLDHTLLVYVYLGSLPVILAVATVFSLAFESPMMALEKIIFSRKPTPPKPKAEGANPGMDPAPLTEMADTNSLPLVQAHSGQENTAFNAKE